MNKNKAYLIEQLCENIIDNVLRNIRNNLNETEYNYHFSGKTTREHDLKPYGSDSKYSMYGRETGHFGSGTYFSTFPSLELNKQYGSNPNPNFIKVGDKTYRVDFDLYKNLYRVRSKKQGDILYTMCYNLNKMYNRMTDFGVFKSKDAYYNNSDVYQIIKNNAEALNLKCPSYYELTRMAQNHKGDQSFSTLFMEYNGYNGVNVSGVEYYDNTKHGSVIYDLSKVNSDMQEVLPKSLYTGYKDTPYNDTVAQDFMGTPEINALKGEDFGWYDKLNDMPLNKAMRVLKNYTMSGKILERFCFKQMNETLQYRYLRLLYTALTKEWSNSHHLLDQFMYHDTKKWILEFIIETNSLYWVNFAKGNESMLIDLLKENEWNIEFNLPIEEENRQKKEYLDILMKYLKRDLTSEEKDFIENKYYSYE